MPRLEEPGRPMATLRRRAVLAAAPAGLLAACEPGMRTTASTTPRLDLEALRADVAALSARPGAGILAVGLMNLESGEIFAVNAARRMPMQSVFKLPLGAAVLAEVDAGRLRLEEAFTLDETQLSPPFSPISEAWPARRDYTARELLLAAVGRSDNTAADVLMKRIGGPGAVTAWLDARRARDIRVDRYERDLQPEVFGMPSFRPEGRAPAAFLAARAQVPPARRLTAMQTYLADPRDTATVEGMLMFLQMLDRQELLSAASTRLLLQIMAASPTGANRVRAGLPRGAAWAHKTGSSGADLGFAPATNDVGIFTLPDRRSYALAVFLAGSTLDEAARDALIAEVGRAAVKGVR